MAGADVKCYKGILVVSNILFFLCGLALIIVGALSLTQVVDFFTSKNLGIGLIILGVLIFFISFIGLIGALKANRGLLKFYFVLVLIIVIIQLGLAIAAFVYRDEIPNLASDAWTASTPEAKLDVQNAFDCCGWSNTTDRAEPETCSIDNGRNDSCNAAVVDAIESNFTAIAVAAIVIGLFQLLILILTCCLIQKVPTKQQQEQALLDEARAANRGETTTPGGKAQYGSYA